MYEVTSSSLLGRLLNDIIASSVDIRSDLEILEETLEESKKKETATNLRLSMEIALEDLIYHKKVELEILEDARTAIEDIIGGMAGLKVDILVDRYLNIIKERYEVDPKRERVKVRILKAEIDAIEAELMHEGYPIFGGYYAYEALMTEEEEPEVTEQIAFDFNPPSSDEKE